MLANSQSGAHVSERRLWFGVLVAPAAWAVQGFTSVILSTNACDAGNLNASAVRIALGVLTIALLAIALWGGVTAFRSWTILSHHRSLLASDAPGREEYMALIGMFSSLVFVIGLLWAGIPPVLLNLCDQRR